LQTRDPRRVSPYGEHLSPLVFGPDPEVATMEFVLWFGFILVAVALAGDHLFLVIFLAAVGQFILAMSSVLLPRHRRRVTW
jgi:hypothetical protein